MKIDAAQCVNKGMQRDYSMDKASQEFAYENRNIRITTSGENSFLSVTNERSTQQISVSPGFPGGFTLLGSCVVGDYWVVFGTTTSEGDEKNSNDDYIYRLSIDYSSKEASLHQLYEGNLNFSVKNPIECIPSFEGEEVQKVYWVDGKNQPRVINIISEGYDSGYSFDFNPTVNSTVDFKCEKKDTGEGNFTSGIVQYFVTFYNKFLPETNCVYESDLYYISPTIRGGEVNEKQTCVFNLTITPKETSFSHMKVYSIIRTSLNSEPEAKIIFEGEVNKNTDGTIAPVIVTDTNNGIYIAPTDILFLGGSSIIASTIEQKNNTLFLGDVKELMTEVSTDAKDILNTIALSFGYKKISKNQSENIYYTYSPNLVSNSKSSHFKYGEYYRVGIQFKLNTGEWTSSIFVRDILCDKKITTFNLLSDEEDLFNPKDAGEICVPILKADLPFDLWDTFFKKYNIVDWRLTYAEHTASSRTIKAQGLLVPTIFNLKERNDKTCFATPMWNLHMAHYTNHLENIDILTTGSARGPINFTVLDRDVYYPDKNRLATVYEEQKEYDKSVLEYRFHAVEIIYANNYYPNITGSHQEGFILMRIVLRAYLDANYTNYHDAYTEYLQIWGDSTMWGTDRLSRWMVDYISVATWNSIKDKIVSYTDRNNDIVEIKIEDIQGINLQNPIVSEEQVPSQQVLQKYMDDIIYGNDSSSHKIRYVTGPFVQYQKAVEQATTIGENADCYFLDANLCSFYSPDLENINSGLKTRIVGAVDMKNTISDYTIEVENAVDASGATHSEYRYNFNTLQVLNREDVEESCLLGITSFPLWPYSNVNVEDPADQMRTAWVHYWQHSGNIVPTGFSLKSKTFANMWYFKDPTYYDINTPIENDMIVDGRIVFPNRNVIIANEDLTLINTDIYKSKYENTIFLNPTDSHIYYAKGHHITLNEVMNTFNDSDGDGASDAIIQDDTKMNIKSVSIKSNSSQHCIVDLGNDGVTQFILPNYESKYDTGNILYESGSRLDYQEVDAVLMCEVSKDNQGYNYLNEEDSKAFIQELVSFFTIPDLNYTINITSDGRQSYTTLHPWAYDEENETETHYTFRMCYTDTSVNNKYNVILKDTEIEKDFVLKVSDFFTGPAIKINREGTLVFDLVIKNLLLNAVVRVKLDRWKSTNLLEIKEMTLLQPEYHHRVKLKGFTETETSNKVALNPMSIECTGLRGGIDYRGIYWRSWRVAFTSFDVANRVVEETTSRFWIGELYTEYNPNTFMGGNTESAIQNNVFIPIFGSYETSSSNSDYITGWGLSGDTYYTRWDHVRIFPISKEDINRPIDAISVMVETYKNLDGDTRELRGRTDVTILTTDNTNDVLNPIYSQSNNFITSAVLDSKFNTAYLPTMYVWSLNKTNLSNVDSWASINTVNSNLLDADKGKLTKIKNWNDKLIAFQEKGIAIINFNEQTTLSTGNGVPVEIANSGRVSGHHYISTTQGCKNKWSIADSPYGIYFIDSYNKSINVFSNDGIKSLSTINLFQDWILENEHGEVWDPTWNNSGFKSFYDPIHKEVYFTNKDESLCYNELLSQFTSFYDYSCVDSMFAYNGHMYGILGNDLHLMFDGYHDNSYCNLFGEEYPYSMTYKINKDPFVDKTWTNIEYRADVFSSGNIGEGEHSNITLDTFDNIEVWNEYQYGVSKKHPKCKFRVWRADIPRDNREGRKGLNRIRNPWVMLKLEKTNNTDKRMEFHDLIVKYLQ